MGVKKRKSRSPSNTRPGPSGWWDQTLRHQGVAQIPAQVTVDVKTKGGEKVFTIDPRKLTIFQNNPIHLDPRSSISIEPPQPSDAARIAKQREEIQHWMDECFTLRTQLADQKDANERLADRASDDAHVMAARLALKDAIQKLLLNRTDHLERQLRLAQRPQP